MHIMRALLMAEGATGSSGGAGATGGTGTEEPPAELFSKDQVDFITKAIGKGVSGALTKFRGEMTTSITEAVKAVVPEIDAALDTKLAALAPAKPGAKGAGETPANDVTEHPVVKGLQKQIADLKKETDAAKQVAETERANTRAQNLRAKVGEHLAAAGVKDPARNKAAVTNLIASGLVDWSKDAGEENTVVFNDSDGTVDVKTGIAAWSKSDDGKIYVAPTTATGSGDRGGGKGPPNTGKGYQRGQFGQALLSELGGMSMVIGGGAPPPAGGGAK